MTKAVIYLWLAILAWVAMVWSLRILDRVEAIWIRKIEADLYRDIPARLDKWINERKGHDATTQTD